MKKKLTLSYNYVTTTKQDLLSRNREMRPTHIEQMVLFMLQAATFPAKTKLLYERAVITHFGTILTVNR